ncbi:hypothetical protein DPMN_157504 [Dreissena polymorpha]|uniref:Uncharacterized protein n=1 Tax=Dreissena polymorpha TaxID=45954 RepID=A0A9D4EI66_DREPO|nr:hypothetical protein DPMN_157504 [Dreissena polymorpha]
MWILSSFKKASLALGGVGLVAYKAATFFGDVNIRVENSAKAQLTDTRMKLTEGFVFKDTIATEIKPKQASSFWVFPKLWFPYLGTKGVASWAISPVQSDSNNEPKHQRLFVLWSAKLLKERKLGVCVTKPCDDVNVLNDVESLDFERLIDADKHDGIDVFEIIPIKKGKANELVVDAGHISIVASMGVNWRPWIDVEVKESDKKLIPVKQPIAPTNKTSLDEEASAVEIKDKKVQDLKILLLLLVVIAFKTYS